MTAPALAVLEALTQRAVAEKRPGARSRTDGWNAAPCPAHEDGTASFGWIVGSDGSIGLDCKAACSHEAVVAALGLTMADLFPPKARQPRARVIHTTEYEVRDAAGELQAIHVRRDRSDGSKGIHWRLPGSGDDDAGLKGRPVASLPLYGSELVKDWPPDAGVVVVEGEKAADALRAAGVHVLATVTGAEHTPDASALEVLRGHTVTLWPDADAVGRKHMQAIAARLEGIAAGVTWLEPPEDAPKGWDGADLLALADDPAAALADDPAAALASVRDRIGPVPAHEPSPLDDDEDDVDDRADRAELIILPPPSDPMAVARVLAEHHVHDGVLTLRHWRGGWWTWARSHWVEREPGAVRADCYAFTEHAVYQGAKDIEPWAPTRYKIANLTEALAAITHLPETVDQPSWIDGEQRSVVAVSNGLLDLDRRELLAHTPRFFNQTAVPFAYDPVAPPPARWLRFLAELWPDDQDSIDALMEFFGYVVSGRTDLHKIMLIVGPTRGGKGTIARIMGKLIGPSNVAGPTLSSLSYDFGMAPLIGKPLAVISDARIDAARDTSIVVERLLAISGEDSITVNRKYREQWTGKLPTRFLVISNELPRLGDASATIANRFVVLLLQRSWLGHEDHGLETALSAELPGILNLALAGLDRLTSQDRFTRPVSTDEAIITLQDLASPVAAFVRDECVIGPTHEVPIEGIWARWKGWAESNGNRPGTKLTLGRNLRAVTPGLRVIQAREGDGRLRLYRGIGLRDEDDPQPGTQWHAFQSNVSPEEPSPQEPSPQEPSPQEPSPQEPSPPSGDHNGAARVPLRANGPDDPPFDPERATDDDAEAPLCDECGHQKVAVTEGRFAGRWVCTGPDHPRVNGHDAPPKPAFTAVADAVGDEDVVHVHQAATSVATP